jgi:predicted ATPase
MYEFKATIPNGCKVLEAYSVSHGKASAWLPVLELLKSYFDIADEDDDNRRSAKVEAKARGLDPALAETLPYILSLLGIAGAGASLAMMYAQIRRRRTLEAIKRVIIRESLKQPLVLIFEDLHWVDDETQEFLNLPAESIANARAYCCWSIIAPSISTRGASSKPADNETVAHLSVDLAFLKQIPEAWGRAIAD